jgi:hypothetical protein
MGPRALRGVRPRRPTCAEATAARRVVPDARTAEDVLHAPGETVGLVDEMAEGALQGQGSGGEGAGGFAVSGALVVIAHPSETGPSKLWLSR